VLLRESQGGTGYKDIRAKKAIEAPDGAAAGITAGRALEAPRVCCRAFVR